MDIFIFEANEFNWHEFALNLDSSFGILCKRIPLFHVNNLECLIFRFGIYSKGVKRKLDFISDKRRFYTTSVDSTLTLSFLLLCLRFAFKNKSGICSQVFKVCLWLSITRPQFYFFVLKKFLFQKRQSCNQHF